MDTGEGDETSVSVDGDPEETSEDVSDVTSLDNIEDSLETTVVSVSASVETVVSVSASVELKLSVELPRDDEVIMSPSDELISELEDCSVLLTIDSVESIELKDVDSRSSLIVLTISDDAELSVETTDDDSRLEEGTSDVTASELLEYEDPDDI